MSVYRTSQSLAPCLTSSVNSRTAPVSLAIAWHFWIAFLVTLLVTLVGVRIPPLNHVPDNYYEGVKPDPEQPIKKDLLRSALREGMDQAQTQAHLGKRR